MSVDEGPFNIQKRQVFYFLKNQRLRIATPPECDMVTVVLIGRLGEASVRGSKRAKKKYLHKVGDLPSFS